MIFPEGQECVVDRDLGWTLTCGGHEICDRCESVVVRASWGQGPLGDRDL